jgi:hypothetical protein
VKSRNNHLTEEGAVTRLNQFPDMTEWMQAVLSSDRDLLADILRAGVQALMEAERCVRGCGAV